MPGRALDTEWSGAASRLSRRAVVSRDATFLGPKVDSLWAGTEPVCGIALGKPGWPLQPGSAVQPGWPATASDKRAKVASMAAGCLRATPMRDNAQGALEVVPSKVSVTSVPPATGASW